MSAVLVGKYPEWGVLPLLAVLAHAHSSTVARGRVAAGALADLEADATAGAAGGPGCPRSPGSIPAERNQFLEYM